MPRLPALGCDPDSRDMAFALWGEGGPIEGRVAHVSKRTAAYHMADALFDMDWALPPLSAIVIEGQQQDKRKAPFRNLAKLAHMTGLALGWIRQQYGEDIGPMVRVPTPYEWKKSQSKHAMQTRLYRELGWGYTLHGTGTSRYAVPKNPSPNWAHFTDGQWKHLGDAILLARWAFDNQRKD